MRHFNLLKKNYRKACIDQCIIQRCNNKLSIVKNQSKLKNLKRKKIANNFDDTAITKNRCYFIYHIIYKGIVSNFNRKSV